MKQRQHCFPTIQTISKHGFIAPPRDDQDLHPQAYILSGLLLFCEESPPHSRRGWGPADTFGKTSRATGLLSAEKEDTMGTDINSRPD